MTDVCLSAAPLRAHHPSVDRSVAGAMLVPEHVLRRGESFFSILLLYILTSAL